jgi:hypothetical protein
MKNTGAFEIAAALVVKNITKTVVFRTCPGYLV